MLIDEIILEKTNPKPVSGIDKLGDKSEVTSDKGIKYQWNTAQKSFIDLRNNKPVKQGSLLDIQLLKKFGLDKKGNAIKPGIFKRAGMAVGGALGQDTLPSDAGLGKKAGTAVGAMVGKAVTAPFKAIGAVANRLKGQGNADDQSPQAEPEQTAQTTTTQNAQPENDIDALVANTRDSMKNLSLQGNKSLPKKAVDNLTKDLSMAEVNKDYYIRTGTTIVRYDSMGYNVKPFVQKWFSLKQQDMQSKDLSRLKVLAGI